MEYDDWADIEIAFHDQCALCGGGRGPSGEFNSMFIDNAHKSMTKGNIIPVCEFCGLYKPPPSVTNPSQFVAWYQKAKPWEYSEERAERLIKYLGENFVQSI